MKREIKNKTQLMARLNACNVCRVYNHVLMIFECHSLIQNVVSLSSNIIIIIIIQYSSRETLEKKKTKKLLCLIENDLLQMNAN